MTSRFLAPAALAMAVLPFGSLAAQLSLWTGSRSYHGGPAQIEHPDNLRFRPLEVREYGAAIRLLRIGNMTLGVTGEYYTGAFGGVGDGALVGFRNQVEGLSFRARMEWPLLRSSDDDSYVVAQVEPGLEHLTLGSSSGHSRFVVSAGPEVSIRIHGRLRFTTAIHVAALTSSAVPQSEVPPEVSNHNNWWSTLRIGASIR